MASCGTALTPQQAQQLRRFAGKVVLSFDPDAAGQGAAAKSCEMLVEEGFEVNVATAAGRRGPRHVRPEARPGRPTVNDCGGRSRIWSICWTGRPRASTCRTGEGRASFVDEAAADPRPDSRPDPAGDCSSRKWRRRAGVSEDAIWAGTTKGGHVQRSATARAPASCRAWTGDQGRKGPDLAADSPAERGPGGRWTALEPADLEGLASSSVLDLARKLNEDRRVLAVGAARAL